ncbi:hypothetical protein LCGC14_2597240 [marine sediment metagenome]|uniref:Uncharacterized protein n=1 Tax=marine sediment metagenome TaxID=412755 RepID=A0A0F9AA35_9ZZZZ
MPLLRCIEMDAPLAISWGELITCLAKHFKESKTEVKRFFKQGALEYKGLETEGKWEKLNILKEQNWEGLCLEGGNIKFGKHRFATLPTETKKLFLEVWDEPPNN